MRRGSAEDVYVGIVIYLGPIRLDLSTGVAGPFGSWIWFVWLVWFVAA